MTLNFSDNHIRIRLKETELQILNTKQELSYDILENNMVIFSYKLKLFEESRHKTLFNNNIFTIMLPKIYLENLIVANKKHGFKVESKNSYTLTLQLDIF